MNIKIEHNHQDCEAILLQIGDFLDGTLDEATCAALKAHLEGCSGCEAVVDTTQKTISLYCSDQPKPEDGLPADVRKRLLACLQENGIAVEDNHE